MSKKKRSNVGSIIIIAVLSIAILFGIVVICVLMQSNIFLIEQPKPTPSVEQPTGNTNLPVDINHEQSGAKLIELTAQYDGGTLFAKGQAIKDNFTVVAVYNDGVREVITDYECPELAEDYRLAEGFNTFHFSKNDIETILVINAVDIRKLAYPPNYVTVKVDEWKATSAVESIKEGNLSFNEYFKNIAFTGDSQIKALSTGNLIALTRNISKVGVSYDYFAAHFDEIVSVSLGCDAIIVHYGINSLSTSASERASRIAQYKKLLTNLKEKLPGTRIIVSGLFPVSSKLFTEQARFRYIIDYNYDLCEMCMELGIDYLSDNEYIGSHQNYFAGDGLHLSTRFYRDYWLYNIITVMGV